MPFSWHIPPTSLVYLPRNGYNSDGASHYSKAFQQAYFQAQAARMNRLVETATAAWKRMQSGKAAYPDDDVFLIPRGQGARLTALDPSIHQSTVKP
jgi:hypothetical protein